MAPAGLDDLLSGLEGSGTREMAFEETRDADLLEEPMTLRGRVVFEPPDGLERHVESPYREAQIIRGERVRLYRNDRPAGRFSLDRAPELVVLRSALTGLLGGDREALESSFRVEFESDDPDQWSLELFPADSDLAGEVEAIRLTGSSGKIETMTLTTAEGEVIETRLEPVP